MSTWMSSSSSGRNLRGSGLDEFSAELARPARVAPGLLKSIGPIALHPIVKITPAEPVKRLGTGLDWWFSESILIPVGSKVEFRFQGPLHLLVLYNEGMRKSGETSIDGLNSTLRGFAHKLTFVPAGCDYREWHETRSSTRLTFLYLKSSAVRRPDNRVEDGFPPRLYFEDSLVWETASKLKNTIESGQAKYLTYLEALSGVLAHELCRVDERFVRKPAVIRGGLASWQKRAVGDYIEDHLGEQVCILTLAGLTRLSLHHFCRALNNHSEFPRTSTNCGGAWRQPNCFWWIVICRSQMWR
jgi:AraC family transcriptional regulator